MTESWDDEMRIRNATGRIMRHRLNATESYLDGDVLTPWGIVTVYSENEELGGNMNLARFDFVFDGILYIRTFKRSFTERGLTLMARKFAKEIAE